jgi:hypothetical protein
MFEVKVLSSGSNVASGKSASQDSTFKGNSDKFGALKAVDGIEGTFSHTAVDASGWWEVDLDGVFPIESVKILNRWCGDVTDPSQCLCRLSHAAISLEYENGNWVDTTVIGDTCGELEIVHEYVRSDEYCNFVPTESPTLYPIKPGGKLAIDLCAKYKTSLPGDCFDVVDERDISSTCNTQMYNVGLLNVPGPHFLIAATFTGDRNSICPSSIVFASVEGKKHKTIISHEDIANLPIHNLGTANLKDLLEAEKAAAAIDEDAFDFATNTCVHYAGQISRTIGFSETDELATFIIQNTVKDDEFEVLARSYWGGFRYLAASALGGKKVLEDHVKDIVYSQLRIDDLMSDHIA